MSRAIGRRRFLKNAAAASLISAFHGPAVWAAGTGSRAAAGAGPRILGLRLLTATPLDRMKAFYQGLLGLDVLEESKRELTIAGGRTPITFVKIAADEGRPFYHFAFNIPHNKLRAAREWQLQRTPLVPWPASKSDPAYPNDVRHFRNWNAHSVFFWDPADNVLEYIARHDLQNDAAGAFTSKDILYASEIALVVDDQQAAAERIIEATGLEAYPRGVDFKWALGDEHGLVLCIPKRQWGAPEQKVRTFDVFPTEARLRGDRSATYEPRGLPYRIRLDAGGNG